MPSVPNQPKTAEIPSKTHPKCIKNAYGGNHRLKIFSGEIPRTPLTKGGHPLSCSPPLMPSALVLTSAGPLLNAWRRACRCTSQTAHMLSNANLLIVWSLLFLISVVRTLHGLLTRYTSFCLTWVRNPEHKFSRNETFLVT